jgi:hypothetical protein
MQRFLGQVHIRIVPRHSLQDEESSASFPQSIVLKFAVFRLAVSTQVLCHGICKKSLSVQIYLRYGFYFERKSAEGCGLVRGEEALTATVVRIDWPGGEAASYNEY